MYVYRACLCTQLYIAFRWYTCRTHCHTGEGLSLSLSVFLRRLAFFPEREEEEEEKEEGGREGLAEAFLVRAARDSAGASN